jgi:hypothetical protein
MPQQLARKTLQSLAAGAPLLRHQLKLSASIANGVVKKVDGIWLASFKDRMLRELQC